MPLVRLLRRLDRVLFVVEVGLVTAALLTMVGLYSVHVFLRNTGHGSVGTFMQVVQHLVLWVSILGASLCVRDRKHIAIEVIHKVVSPSGRRVLEGLVTFSTLLVCLLLAWVAGSYVIGVERAEYLTRANPEPLFILWGI